MTPDRDSWAGAISDVVHEIAGESNKDRKERHDKDDKNQSDRERRRDENTDQTNF